MAASPVVSLPSRPRIPSLPVVTLVLLVVVVQQTVQVESLECVRGYGTGAAAGKKVTIPNDWINDGYCDCPHDGSDEPATGACSGSLIGGWAGIEEETDTRCVDDAVLVPVHSVRNRLVELPTLTMISSLTWRKIFKTDNDDNDDDALVAMEQGHTQSH